MHEARVIFGTRCWYSFIQLATHVSSITALTMRHAPRLTELTDIAGMFLSRRRKLHSTKYKLSPER
ncbi:hypothetical protein HBH46_150650 [Parastagonospora nodorum]|nr:hypothetical protein HBH46_150650 [Parastagonospora nodorum]